MISREATPIRRHRNPAGIFSRMLIYPLIGVGAWRHELGLVGAGVVSEALLWTVVPPVDKTYRFIDDAIDRELSWLNSPTGAEKSASFTLLGLFPIVGFAGLWKHSRQLLVGSVGLLGLFYGSMRHLADHRSCKQTPAVA